jgi:hypothetical protein
VGGDVEDEEGNMFDFEDTAMRVEGNRENYLETRLRRADSGQVARAVRDYVRSAVSPWILPC